MKFIFIFTALFLTSILSSSDISNTDDELLWEKQINYLNNLKYLYSSLESLNSELDECREKYFISADEKNKEFFLKTTEKHSIETLSIMGMVSQSIKEMEFKMENNKNLIIKNLRKFENELDSHLEKNSLRTEKIINNISNGMKEIYDYYCK